MNKKGITLTSVIIYVVLMLVIVGIVGTVTSFFYSSTQDLEKSVDSIGEFNKFNAYFLEETKNIENEIKNISDASITFESEVTFKFVDTGIYRNKVKICSEVKACQFSTYTQNEKTVIKVYIEIGDSFARNMEYVMGVNTLRTSRRI